ncbi:MAG: hypothetical protein IPP91_20355 [Betaproteobacteria bacterium]|nr:hypothetical protein [Betaproteobacteria bacterium]
MAKGLSFDKPLNKWRARHDSNLDPLVRRGSRQPLTSITCSACQQSPLADGIAQSVRTEGPTGPTYAAFAAAFLVAIFAVALDSAEKAFPIYAICFGIACALGTLRESIVRIRVGHSEFVCEYLPGNRTARYSDVIDMNVETRYVG